MRKTFIALGIFTIVNAAPAHVQILANAQTEVPAYAKWGKLAVQETQAKYPAANIIDYLHEGSESIGDSTVEKFKLWLKEDDHEFGVFVRIEYNSATEKVIAISFLETPS
ncbi:DUF3889 domain-containing protein [Sporosarcina sp. 6E9]|uniref:DUF3889 domain-containing protein n=1 Tax=Sporosarcina sp. 6E9 TaxID=2819235 RepID=UPI001B30A7A6|nr:DUF3889 domain-containing protein [Sporosarcina sp. 6E9]